MDGQVPDSVKFPKWLERQDKATQLEVLGPARYKLWKDGTPIDRFVQDNRVLNLEELKKTEAA